MVRSSSWTEPQTGTANTEVVATHSAVLNQAHHVAGFSVSTYGAAVGADAEIEIKSGTRLLHREYIGSGEARGANRGGNFAFPLRGDIGTAITLTVGELGAGCIAEINLWGYTE